MNKSAKILTVVFVALIASPTLTFAQVRDAASKALGDYARSGPSQWTAPVTAMNTVAVTAPRAQQPEHREFSYDAKSQAPPIATATQGTAPLAKMQPEPSRAVRSFSYEPGTAAARPTYFPSRGWQNGVRDAGSKVRGDY